MSELKLIYGHDPLCGWCYGFIPALTHFAEARPDIPIEIVEGGLFPAEKVRPYAAMDGYIGQAFERVKARTGRKGAPAFFSMITDPETGDINSAPPSHAVLQVAEAEPEKAVAFAHAIQDLHFEHGMTFNAAGVYERAQELTGVKQVDVDAALRAGDEDPLVRKSYDRAARLGITSFPMSLVMDKAETRTLGIIDGQYDPKKFLAEFEAIEKKLSATT